jgi:hypothetical protein
VLSRKLDRPYRPYREFKSNTGVRNISWKIERVMHFGNMGPASSNLNSCQEKCCSNQNDAGKDEMLILKYIMMQTGRPESVEIGRFI